MGKKKSKKRDRAGAGTIFAVLLVLMAASVAVRWSGIGNRFSNDEFTFTMEVLNGTGTVGLAKRTTKELRRMGIDVLIEGNADSFNFNESVLVDRKGNPALMRHLSRLLDCRRIVIQIDERSHVDVTFIVGRDIDRLKIAL